jgi:hypothetical protein
MKSGFSATTCIRLALTATFLFALAAACNKPPEVNPWVDDSIPTDTWGTPSRHGVFAAAEPNIREKDVPPTPAPYVCGEVPHYPLYWQDPFAAQGDNNRYMAWTWQDYVAMPYSVGRFLVNTMGWPVSVVHEPPFSRVVSDGRVNREMNPHDARPGISPDPTATGQDFNFPDTRPARDEQAEASGP